MSPFVYCYAECHYAECHYAECHYAECHYAVCHYVDCRCAECRYAESSGTLVTAITSFSNLKIAKVLVQCFCLSWKKLIFLK
jgi:hypothetical protein